MKHRYVGRRQIVTCRRQTRRNSSGRCAIRARRPGTAVSGQRLAGDREQQHRDDRRGDHDDEQRLALRLPQTDRLTPGRRSTPAARPPRPSANRPPGPAVPNRITSDAAPSSTGQATAVARAPIRCGSPRTPVSRSSSRSGSTFARCADTPNSAPATIAQGPARPAPAAPAWRPRAACRRRSRTARRKRRWPSARGCRATRRRRRSATRARAASRGPATAPPRRPAPVPAATPTTRGETARWQQACPIVRWPGRGRRRSRRWTSRSTADRRTPRRPPARPAEGQPGQGGESGADRGDGEGRQRVAGQHQRRGRRPAGAGRSRPSCGEPVGDRHVPASSHVVQSSPRRHLR